MTIIYHDNERSALGLGTVAGVPRRQFLKAAAAAGLTLALTGEVGLARAATAEKAAKSGGVDLYAGAVDAQGQYVLPPLPYAYDALEPHLDEATLHLHHDKHHKAYVEGLLKAEKDLAQARGSGDFAPADFAMRRAAFNGGGHFLHCIYWVSLSPKPAQPSADLQKAIERDFGSLKICQEELASAAKGVMGGGWGILCWSIPAKKLIILQTQNHDLMTQWANIPLVVADVWEHAYYKKYSNDRGAYLKALMEIINWEGASARYDAIRQALA